MSLIVFRCILLVAAVSFKSPNPTHRLLTKGNNELTGDKVFFFAAFIRALYLMFSHHQILIHVDID